MSKMRDRKDISLSVVPPKIVEKSCYEIILITIVIYCVRALFLSRSKITPVQLEIKKLLYF